MAATKTAIPAKPYPDFPLFPHGNGQWAKKMKGKLWFFGVWGDPDAALKKYVQERDEIQAGRDPRRGAGVARVSSQELTVYDMCNLYLQRQENRVKAGELSQRHFVDGLRTCKRMGEHFGKFQRAAALLPGDFAAFRLAFPRTWGAVIVGNEIQRVRSVFKWAAESGMLPSMPNFGPDFRKPDKATQRRERQKRQAARGGRLDFTAAEAKALVDNADGWLRACILLGLNGGFGNADCGRLSTQFFDVESGWYDLPRAKSGIDRRFPLWPETAEAIRETMRARPIAKDDADDALCFLTSHGRPVASTVTTEGGSTYLGDALGVAFNKLCKRLKIDRPGRGFYSLRRTFETVAGESRDQPSVDLVMGHADVGMAAVYRQGISDERLRDVCELVRKWLFGLA